MFAQVTSTINWTFTYAKKTKIGLISVILPKTNEFNCLFISSKEYISCLHFHGSINWLTKTINVIAVLILLMSTVTANMSDPRKAVNLHTQLHFDKPKSKSDLNNEDFKIILLTRIQDLSLKSCNYFVQKQPKACKCLECLRNNNPSQEAVAHHLFQWAELDKEKHDNFIINEIHVLVKIE